MITIGQLCDKLSIVNIKIFFLENTKRDPNASDGEIAEATKKTNSLNSERNAIIDQIDIQCNELANGTKQKLFGATKMYGK